MKVEFETILPIQKIENNIIVNHYGDIAACFAYQGKEMFSMTKEQFEETNRFIDTAYNFLDESFVVHKQDLCLESVYNSGEPEFPTFHAKAFAKHFDGKVYYKNYSYLYLIRTEVLSIHRDYSLPRTVNPKGKGIELSLNEFENTVKQFKDHFHRGGLNLVELSQDHTEKLIEGYFSFFQTGMLVDIVFSPEFRIGDKYGSIFSLNNDENQPLSVEPFGVNKDFSTPENKVYSDMLNNLGYGLKTNHILNQMFFLDGQRYWKKKLEKKAKDLSSLRKFSPGNGKLSEDHKKFLDATIDSEGEKRVVRMHMNIMFWADSQKELENLKGEVKGRSIELGMKLHQANYLDIRLQYLSGCPGNAGTMPNEETFVTHSDLATCYFIKESVYDRSKGKPSTNGLQFADRASGIPMYRDSWFKPYETKQIDNRNWMAIGLSGAGKSSTLIEIGRQYLEMGNFLLSVIDIGRSWELLAKEFDGNHIVYVPGMSLGVNPFEIVDGLLDVDRLEYLATFIFILWKPREVLEDEKRAALEKVIIAYYQATKDGASYKIGIDGHSSDIAQFYIWVEANKMKVAEISKGREDFFDIDSFLITLDQFVTGKFANLFATKGVKKLIDPTKHLTVWELDNIKDHPTLFPIFAMLITYMNTEVLWKKASANKIFIYDEAWKILEKPGMGIQLKYAYKTYRKFEAAVGISIQTIGDINIPDTNIEETILGNSSIKHIMKHNYDLVGDLVKKIKLNKHHQALLGSIRNDLSGKYGYFEHLHMIGSDVKVVRTMVSPQQRVLLMSEFKDKVELFKVVEEAGSWHEGIEKYIRLKEWI